MYALARLLGRPGLRLREALDGAAEIFRQALERPELARVSLRLEAEEAESVGEAASPSGEAAAGPRLEARGEGGGLVLLQASYPASPGSPRAFGEREELLGSSLTSLLADFAARLAALELLAARAEELDRKNVALSELLSRIEAEKRESRAALAAELSQGLSPLIARLRGASAEDCAELAGRLEAVLGAGLRGLADPSRLLSAREAEVVRLAASGLTSKEIASRLGISHATVERHRYNARRKLGARDRRESLGALLAAAASKPNV